MPDLAFRLARDADAAAVVPLVNGAYRGDSTGGTGWTHEKDLVAGARIDEAGFRAYLSAPDSVVLLAERRARVVGCVHLVRQEEECFLGMLSVHVAEQASGVGRALLAEAERYARDGLGARVMAMRVVTVRAELLAWYERRGYRRTGRVEAFAPRADAVSLRGPLDFERLEKPL